jgi:hypothetical protein
MGRLGWRKGGKPMWQLEQGDGIPGTGSHAVWLAWSVGIGIWLAALVCIAVLF